MGAIDASVVKVAVYIVSALLAQRKLVDFSVRDLEEIVEILAVPAVTWYGLSSQISVIFAGFSTDVVVEVSSHNGYRDPSVILRGERNRIRFHDWDGTT